MQFKTDGIVIRQQKINDNDRYLTILTRDSGVIHAYANRANNIRSPFCTSTSLMSYSDFIFSENKGNYRVCSADLRNAFFKIGRDLTKVSLSAYLLDISATVGVTDGLESEPLLRLLLNTLFFLEKDGADLFLLKTLFEVRALTLAGFAPQVAACCDCNIYPESAAYFFITDGELLCPSCMESRERKTGGRKLEKDLLDVLRVMVFGKLSDAFKIRLPKSRMRKLSEITEEFCRCQLEKAFDTLTFFYDTVQ